MSRGGIEGGPAAAGAKEEGGGCGVLLVAGVVVFLLTLLPMALGPMLTPRAYAVMQVVLCEDADVGGEVVVRTSRSRRGKSTYSWDYECRTLGGALRRVEGPGPLPGAWALSNGFLVAIIALSFAGHRALSRFARGGAAPSRPAGEPS